jgi:pantothenate kinase
VSTLTDPPTPHPTLPAAALVRLTRLMNLGRRAVLGLTGPPGAGKSTLATALRAACGGAAQLVPMDGFHLANTELQRLGRRGRKGAPDTFDAAGYVELLRRLRHQGDNGADDLVYAPEYRREIEEGIAGAIGIVAGTRLIITEGNYLLLQQGAWADVAALLDECWYVDGDDALRIERLTRRHVQFGRTPDQAGDWVAHTDEPNAQAIAATRARADWVFRWDGE